MKDGGSASIIALAAAVAVGGALGLSFAGLRRVRVRTRRPVPRRRVPLLTRTVSLVGMTLVAASPATPRGPRADSPSGSLTATASPPWESDAGDALEPWAAEGAARPPGATTPAGEARPTPLAAQSSSMQAQGSRSRSVVSSSWSGPSASPPPPWAASRKVPPPPSRERLGAGPGGEPEPHSAGNATAAEARQADPGHPARTYTVRKGDSLWGIAGLVLNTDDPIRIARYWPKLHRQNRDVVGRDPNLIRPGQVLHLPPEGDPR